jgi:hypothetical protein
MSLFRNRSVVSEGKPRLELLDRSALSVVLLEQECRPLLSKRSKEPIETLQVFSEQLGEIKGDPSSLAPRRGKILLKQLDRYGLLLIVAEQRPGLLPLSNFGELIDTPRGSSGLLEQRKGGLPGHLLWASGVFLAVYGKAVSAFPEKPPERPQVALPSKALLNSLSKRIKS